MGHERIGFVPQCVAGFMQAVAHIMYFHAGRYMQTLAEEGREIADAAQGFNFDRKASTAKICSFWQSYADGSRRKVAEQIKHSIAQPVDVQLPNAGRRVLQ